MKTPTIMLETQFNDYFIKRQERVGTAVLGISRLEKLARSGRLKELGVAVWKREDLEVIQQ